MKKSLNLLFGLSLAILCFCCDPDKEPVTPTAPGTGAITPVGTPEGPVQTASIGPAGGTIQSADQRLTISIPAGALTESKTISIQPIGNHCPAGAGKAFRLTPHGLTFAKAARITFQYSEHDVNSSAPEALQVAYQTDKGHWQAPVVKGLDTTSHAITVETTHFSDWALFKRIFINPLTAIVDPGSKVQLDVFETVAQTSSDDELVLHLPVRTDAKHLDRWQLAGEGTLTPNKTSADYQAPNSIPATNPAAVSVFLKGSVTIEGREYKDIRLISNVYVAPEGISVQIDGGDWRTFPGGANINATHNVVTGKIGSESASVIWKGAPNGTYHWTKSTDVAFNMLAGPMIYQHIYGTQATVSGGSLKVDDSHPDWALGTFILNPAGWIRTSTPLDPMGTANIKGVFRMKRVQ